MKLQITAIFDGAYKFLFANVFAIIGIMWLPYTVAILITAFAAMGAVPLQWWHGDFSAMTQDAVLLMIPKFIGLGVIVFGTWIVASSMVTVGVQRRALGLSQGPVFAYFSLSGPVWRLIGASFLFSLAAIAICIGLILACTLIIVGAKAVLSEGLTVLIGILAGVAAWCGFLYVIVRWSFFIAPVVVAENRIGLGHAWHLGRGNFWRIFAIVIVVYLPISVVGGMLTQVLLPLFGGATNLNNLPDHPTAAQIGAALHQLFVGLLPASGISTLFQSIALAGATNGAQALAYRQMTEASAT